MSITGDNKTIHALLLFLPLLILLSNAVDGRLSGHKLPYYPLEFKATVQVLDHKVLRSVDRMAHRVRIDNPQENITTLILAAKVLLSFFSSVGGQLKYMPFLRTKCLYLTTKNAIEHHSWAESISSWIAYQKIQHITQEAKLKLLCVRCGATEIHSTALITTSLTTSSTLRNSHH